MENNNNTKEDTTLPSNSNILQHTSENNQNYYSNKLIQNYQLETNDDDLVNEIDYSKDYKNQNNDSEIIEKKLTEKKLNEEVLEAFYEQKQSQLEKALVKINNKSGNTRIINEAILPPKYFKNNASTDKEINNNAARGRSVNSNMNTSNTNKKSNNNISKVNAIKNNSINKYPISSKKPNTKIITSRIGKYISKSKSKTTTLKQKEADTNTNTNYTKESKDKINYINYNNYKAATSRHQSNSKSKGLTTSTPKFNTSKALTKNESKAINYSKPKNKSSLKINNKNKEEIYSVNLKTVSTNKERDSVKNKTKKVDLKLKISNNDVEELEMSDIEENINFEGNTLNKGLKQLVQNDLYPNKKLNSENIEFKRNKQLTFNQDNITNSNASNKNNNYNEAIKQDYKEKKDIEIETPTNNNIKNIIPKSKNSASLRKSCTMKVDNSSNKISNSSSNLDKIESGADSSIKNKISLNINSKIDKEKEKEPFLDNVNQLNKKEMKDIDNLQMSQRKNTNVSLKKTSITDKKLDIKRKDRKDSENKINKRDDSETEKKAGDSFNDDSLAEIRKKHYDFCDEEFSDDYKNERQGSTERKYIGRNSFNRDSYTLDDSKNETNQSLSKVPYDTLSKIYDQRIRSNKEKFSQYHKSTPNLNEFFKKNVKWLKNKEDKLKAQRIDIKSHEMDGCTFKPVLSKSSDKIYKKSKEHLKNLGTFEKNMYWKRNVEKAIQSKHLVQERKLYEECIFEPQITKDPILMRSRSVKNDGMYIKTTIWKNRLEDEKKKKAEEYQQQLLYSSILLANKSRMINSYNKSFSKEAITLKEEQQKLRILENIKNNKDEICYEILEMKKLIEDLKETLNENSRIVGEIDNTNLLIDESTYSIKRNTKLNSSFNNISSGVKPKIIEDTFIKNSNRKIKRILTENNVDPSIILENNDLESKYSKYLSKVNSDKHSLYYNSNNASQENILINTSQASINNIDHKAINRNINNIVKSVSNKEKKNIVFPNKLTNNNGTTFNKSNKLRYSNVNSNVTAKNNHMSSHNILKTENNSVKTLFTNSNKNLSKDSENKLKTEPTTLRK